MATIEEQIERGQIRGLFDTTKIGPELIAFVEDRASMLASLRGEMSEGYRTWLDSAVNAMRVANERLYEVLEARQTIADALSDSAYLAGVTAGWNASQADDPNAALAALQQSRSGHMAGYKEAKAKLAAALARPRVAVE